MSKEIKVKSDIMGENLSNRPGESFFKISFTVDDNQLEELGINPNKMSAPLIVKLDTTEEGYEMVNHPSHYNRYPIEAVEMARRIWGDEAIEKAAEITAFFYRMRLGLKPENSVKQEIAKEEFWLNYARSIRDQINTRNGNGTAAPLDDGRQILND